MTGTLLEVDGLNASYGAGLVLRDVCFEIAEGRITSLLGRTGAGKTSTLRSIMGAGIERSGRTVLRGVDVSAYSIERIAAQGVSWVPDNRRIFARLTVEQNLALGAAAVRKPRRTIPVAELCRAFPMLGPLLRRHGDQLSGGQQQIVAIARAIASQPALLLLDEPTEGLAPVIVDEVVEIIRQLPQEFGVGILLVEQNASVAQRLAEEVIVLRLGEVAHRGELSSLTEDADLQRRLLGLQLN